MSLIIAFLLAVGVGTVVWKVPPSPVIESLAIAAFAVASFIVVGWLTGSMKKATQIVIFGMGILIMNRFGLLGWITGGLWVVVWGLISLIG